MQWSIKTVATLYLFVCKHEFDWVVKPVVDNSSESTDTHLPECIASLILLLLFVNLQDFLVDLLYVHVGQEGGSVLANCLGMFPCSSCSLSFANNGLFFRCHLHISFCIFSFWCFAPLCSSPFQSLRSCMRSLIYFFCFIIILEACGTIYIMPAVIVLDVCANCCLKLTFVIGDLPVVQYG